jgi:uncharacterized protein
MTPIFFGSANRRLFGIFEPRRNFDRPRVAVLCAPWGQEYLRAHRSIRKLAVMLSASGWDALRFDYYGTGDSAGDLAEASIASWRKDIEWAIEEANAMSGTSRVALIGLRIGANLAADVAKCNSKLVEALVLWDPVVRGTEFLKEVHALETTISGAAPLERTREIGGGHEILGFPLSSEMAREMRAIDLIAAAAALPARTLTIVSQPTASYEALVAAYAEHPGKPLSVEQYPGLPAWGNDRYTGAGAIPVRALQRIIQWLC